MSAGLDRETLELTLEAIRDFARERLPDEKLLELDARDWSSRSRSCAPCVAEISACSSCSFPSPTAAWGVGTVKNHLKYCLEVNGQTYRAIGFGLAEKMESINMAEPVHLAVKFKNSVFRGVKRTELHTVEVFQPLEITEQE